MDRARPVWGQGVEDGLIAAPSPEEALAAAAGLSLSRRLALGDRGRDAAETLAEPTSDSLIARAIRVLIGDLTRRLQTVTETARRRQWGPDRYREEILAAGARFRAAESQAATYNLITNPGATAAAQRVGALADFAAGLPYRVYRIRGINTRPNHEALEGMTWRKGWEGESVVVPPNGWNCFCRVFPVDYVTALSLGWKGETPLGTGPFERFIALGGPDTGFDKGAFV